MQSNTKYIIMDKEEFELLDDSEKEEGMYLLTVLNSIVDVKVVDKYTTIILRDSIYNNFDLNFEPELVKVIRKKQNELIEFPQINVIKSSTSSLDYYYHFDSWVDYNGESAPTVVPAENVTLYAKRKSFNVPLYIKILVGNNEQSMVENYTINSDFIFYIKDNYELEENYNLIVNKGEWKDENGIKSLSLLFNIDGDIDFDSNIIDLEGQIEIYSDVACNNVLGKIDVKIYLYISDSSTGD